MINFLLDYPRLDLQNTYCHNKTLFRLVECGGIGHHEQITEKRIKNVRHLEFQKLIKPPCFPHDI